MRTMKQILIWASRIRHCRGFGIQSPTDYQFVRHVVCQSSPYYAYDEIGKNDSGWHRRLGRLCFRLANNRQPNTIFDLTGTAEYLHAGCKNATIATDLKAAEQLKVIDLAVVPLPCDYPTLFEHCDEQSVAVFYDTDKHRNLWHIIENDERAVITFDLYYCGIVFFTPNRTKQNYIVNI